MVTKQPIHSKASTDSECLIKTKIIKLTFIIKEDEELQKETIKADEERSGNEQILLIVAHLMRPFSLYTV